MVELANGHRDEVVEEVCRHDGRKSAQNDHFQSVDFYALLKGIEKDDLAHKLLFYAVPQDFAADKERYIRTYVSTYEIAKDDQKVAANHAENLSKDHGTT